MLYTLITSDCLEISAKQKRNVNEKNNCTKLCFVPELQEG